MTSAVIVKPVAVPEGELAPDVARAVDVYVELCNRMCREDTGHDDLVTDAAEAIGMFRARDDRRADLFVAERDGEIVGAMTTAALVEAPEYVEFDLVVLAALRGQGVEDALLRTAQETADGLGLATLQTWSLHGPETPARPLVPSTGVGAIDAAAPFAAFLLGQGFSLEQVERNSRFDLTGDLGPVARMRDAAAETGGADYEVVSWVGAAPEEHVEEFAQTIARMSTDAPQGGMTVEAETWDAARVRRRERRMHDQGLLSSIVAVVHRPTGAVAAYNELVIGEDRTEATSQFGTLVLREHRGRRLGALVKAEGLLRWHALVPESTRVTTFNAEENTFMLAINEELGFVPASYAGAWKRVLSPADA